MENERWRQAVGFPDYAASDAGRVKRLTQGGRRYPPGYILAPKKHQRGYVVYTLKNGNADRTVLAHRLVALTWIGQPPTPEHEVAHEDGTRTNNHYTNLSWKTPKANQADRKRHGTYVDGEAAYSAKLTDNDVADIRRRYSAGGARYVGASVTMQALAEEYGVSIAQISRIVNVRQRYPKPEAAPGSGDHLRYD